MNPTRKTLSLLLALILSISLASPALAADWYAGAAQWAREQGLLTSISDMEQPVTAEELSAMLAALTGGAKTEGSAALTRAEAVTMLSDALRPSFAAADWHPFTDAAEADAALA